jgi:ribonuclease H / adenosylcobalamin/alpha-ribazole phosphatase
VSTFHLIRHGTCDPVGVSLAGRAPGIHLNRAGRTEAQRLAQLFRGFPVMRVVSSPRERAMETAAAVASVWGREVEVLEELDELHFGRWTGREIASLAGDPEWERFNKMRGVAAAPGGESMLEVQARAFRALERLRGDDDSASVCVVTHAEVIRGVIANCAGIPLDRSLAIQVDTGSVSTVIIEREVARIVSVNSIPC